MPHVSPLFLAAGTPLFGSQFLALLLVLALIALFIGLVALLGRWLAATHPEDPAKIKHTPDELEPDPELATEAPDRRVLAAISAAVMATMGRKAHIVAVQTLHSPSVEALMIQWSLEGRRQIYTSHKVR